MNNWRPRAGRQMLAQRARLLERIRAFMKERGILEVETPVLGRFGNPDPNLHSFVARSPGTDDPEDAFYLQTSPEFYMKRLVAAGSGPVYQIGKVFRAAEAGRLHEPEFTMLEWYRPGFDHRAIMDEIAELLQALQLPEAERRSYAGVFGEHTGLDPHLAGDDALYRAAAESGLNPDGADRNLLLDHLFSRLVCPHLGRQRPCFVYDFPACQAALARLRSGPGHELAERFELFINTMEIANGYNELTEYHEQDSRFGAENRRRRRKGLPEVPPDPGLLAALQSGLPDCAGVAVGIDRLLMVMTGAACLQDVLAFPLR